MLAMQKFFYLLLKFFMEKYHLKRRTVTQGATFFVVRNMLGSRIQRRGRDSKASRLEQDYSKQFSKLSVPGEARRGLVVLSQQALLISENHWDNSSGWQRATWSFSQSTHSMWSSPSVTLEFRSTEQKGDFVMSPFISQNIRRCDYQWEFLADVLLQANQEK